MNWVCRIVPVMLALSGLATGQSTELPEDYARSPKGERLTSEEWAALDQGRALVHLEEIPDTPVKKAIAIAVMDAAPEEVFAVLTDYPKLPQFMPYCKRVQLQKQDGDKTRVRFDLDFPWPVSNRHYVLDLTDRRESLSGATVWSSRWTYVPGSGNINDTYGSWEVLAYGEGRSFVRYTVFTDPGGKLPNWARNMATEIAVPKVIEGLRKRVKEKSREK